MKTFFFIVAVVLLSALLSLAVDHPLTFIGAVLMIPFIIGWSQERGLFMKTSSVVFFVVVVMLFAVLVSLAADRLWALIAAAVMIFVLLGFAQERGAIDVQENDTWKNPQK